MPTAEKQQQIQEFKELYDDSQLMVVVENLGLNAEETVALRRKIFQTGGKLRVFKNTLAVKALGDDLGEDLKGKLVGPNAYLFGGENFIDDLKGVVEFGKSNKEKISVKCGTLDGEYLDNARLTVLSTLPGKDQLRAQLLGTLIAPVRGLVTALSGNIGNFVNVINNIKEQKEKQS
jgi:large subunit ribosomal protein L10